MRQSNTAINLADPEIIAQVDPFCWALFNKLRVGGGQFTVVGHEQQVAVLQSTDRRQCAKKATQKGWTEALVIRALHKLRYGVYPQGMLYLFPTADEVSTFSKSRFKPFLSNNFDAIGRYVQETDANDIKRIGDSFLYFRGARMTQMIEGSQKTSSKLKSTPADAVYFDELDEMDPDAIDMALARMQHSHIKEEFYLANPTVPQFGIDKLYQQSDQRVWTIECQACGRETCLDLEFPNCFARQKDGSVLRVCKHCGKEIHSRNGYWVAQYPTRSKDLVGWWDSQLCSIYVTPKTLLDEYEDPDTDMVRFQNLKLGRAYINSEDRLSHNDIYLCCGNDTMASSSHGPCGMGVDVGSKLHVLIGQRVGEKGAKILKMVRVDDFNALWDLTKKFNVKSVVFDMHPEIHKVREFCSAADFPAFGCIYSEFQIGVAAWNESSKTVTVNRTELCDATHKLVTTPGRLELPRKDDEVTQFAQEVTNIAKVLEEDKKTGGNKYRYRKLGEDHYRHTLNYLLLALSQVQPVNRAGAVQTKAVDFYYA